MVFNILQCCIRNSELAGPIGSNCFSADRVNLELKEWIFWQKALKIDLTIVDSILLHWEQDSVNSSDCSRLRSCPTLSPLITSTFFGRSKTLQINWYHLKVKILDTNLVQHCLDTLKTHLLYSGRSMQQGSANINLCKIHYRSSKLILKVLKHCSRWSDPTLSSLIKNFLLILIFDTFLQFWQIHFKIVTNVLCNVEREYSVNSSHYCGVNLEKPCLLASRPRPSFSWSNI